MVKTGVSTDARDPTRELTARTSASSAALCFLDKHLIVLVKACLSCCHFVICKHDKGPSLFWRPVNQLLLDTIPRVI